MNDEIVTIKDELHYLMPHIFVNGNSARCGDCRYFVPNVKQTDPSVRGGKCKSRAHLEERGQVAPGSTFDGAFCRWWFPIEKVAGEQEELYGEKA